LLDREQHAITERAAFVPAEKLHFGDEHWLDRDYTVAPGRTSPELVDYRPQPLAGEPEPNLPSSSEPALGRLRDMQGFQPPRPQLPETR
jgi:hypothetical protein